MTRARWHTRTMLSIKLDARQLDDAIAKMAGFSQRRMNAAIATALTRTARDAREAVRAELKRSIDRPTPYTINGLKFQSATAQRLEARIWYGNEWQGGKVGQGRYLYPQIEGGPRTLKRFEKALQAKGAMPYSMLAVPGPGAKLDQYGNVSRGQIVQILSQLGTELTAGYSRTLDRTKKGKVRAAYGRAGGQYVAITTQRGKLKPGIYIATGQDFGRKWGFGRTGKLLPVFFFVRSVRYTARFRFYEEAQRVGMERIGPNVQQAINESAARLAAKA